MRDIQKQISCAQVEDILIEQTFRKLRRTEKQQLERHLSCCNECRDLENRIKHIADTAKIKDEMIPSPAVYQHLISQMAQLNSRHESGLIKWLSRLKDLFEYRIPVYQVALGILILFSAILINTFSLPLLPSQGREDGRFDTTESVLHWQFIEKQSVQKGIEADTILTRLINSAL